MSAYGLTVRHRDCITCNLWVVLLVGGLRNKQPGSHILSCRHRVLFLPQSLGHLRGSPPCILLACPLCLAQRHSWECAWLTKEDGVFSGAGNVIQTSHHKNTDPAREYLVSPKLKSSMLESLYQRF